MHLCREMGAAADSDPALMHPLQIQCMVNAGIKEIVLVTHEQFLDQFKALRKMGPLENLLGLIPGMDKMKGSGVDEKQMRRVEAIILSMTPGERSRPDVLNARRRQRVARGSGTTVTEVNNLLRRFSEMKKLMKSPGKLKKMMTRAGSMGMLGRNQ